MSSMWIRESCYFIEKHVSFELHLKHNFCSDLMQCFKVLITFTLSDLYYVQAVHLPDRRV